jgi:outer membrane protein assembly factor BamD
MDFSEIYFKLFNSIVLNRKHSHKLLYICCMTNHWLFGILLTISVVSFSGCSNYQKVLKSTDYSLKRKTALELYQKKDYQRAYPLLEELVAITRGTTGAEDIYFYYCYCNYYLDDLISAAYHFEQFAKTYPASEKSEEASYMHAYCYYLGSPDYTLDQSNSVKAIEQLQLFINKFPNSTRISQCNEHIDLLRAKLEKKELDLAMLYFRMMDYKAAVIALKNLLESFPNTSSKDEIMLTILKSNYLLAENSVESKKMERYKLVIDDYNRFIDKFAPGKFAEQAKVVHERALNRYNEYKL